MEKGLISVIVPCYNTGRYLSRLLDTLLEQDYPMVEILMVDDGSVDNTREVILAYQPKFENRGYSLEYVYQKNGGQSVAINRGLKWAKGEYLCWPDSDDYYCDASFFTKMVREMRSGGYAIGRSRVAYVNESGSILNISPDTPVVRQENQFENCLFNRNFTFCAIGSMLDMQVLDEVIPRRDIFTEKPAGQNWQLMLPLMYRRRCFFLPDVCACITQRNTSHSRNESGGYAMVLNRMEVYERTILGTLQRMMEMPCEEKQEYTRLIQKKYYGERMRCALAYRNSPEAMRYMTQLQASGERLHWLVKGYCRFCGKLVPFFFLRILRRVLCVSI